MATLPRNRSRARHSYRALLAAVAFLIALSQSAIASAQASEYRGRIGQVGCRPVKERTGETGCWILVNASVGKLPVGQFIGTCIRIRHRPRPTRRTLLAAQSCRPYTRCGFLRSRARIGVPLEASALPKSVHCQWIHPRNTLRATWKQSSPQG